MKTYFCNDCEVLQSSARPAEPDRSMCIAIDSDAAHEIASALRACSGIPYPEVTIPALGEALDTLVKVEFGSLKGAQQWNKQHNGSGYWPHIIDLLSKLNPSNT